MKRCPTCDRTFADQSLSFCIEDGTPLVQAGPPSFDPEATMVVPSAKRSRGDEGSADSTRKESGPNDWKAPAYQPPGQFAAPGAKERRAWPWVVGIVVLLLIAVAGIGVAAVIVIPNMMRATQNGENNANVNANTERNLNANLSANANTNANSFVVTENKNENANANTNANTELGTEAPTDSDEVLSDLTDLEKEWTEANFSADKKKLARILADDYVGTQDGIIQGKADYLRDIKPDDTVKDWELKDLKLTLKGDRATLKGRMRQEREGVDEDLVLQFTDKFVWRDGRWQAVASEVSQVK